jgi:hypothetical protein
VTKSPKTHAGKGRGTRTKGAATMRTSKPAAKKKSKTRAAPAGPTSPASEQQACDDEAAFVETLIATGEAARLDQQGRLPAGATHKIVEDEAGNVKVVRRRFSIT